uniref:OmpA family protein n=1 Tax=Trichocoleus desertorum TaxID=1481672 RepID=UPI0025B30E9D|nr:OmpA family protein [Trichocoleus desertorum]
MTPVSKASSPTIRPPKQNWPLLVFMFRLLLLLVGGGFAWLGGVVAATFYPAPNPEPPLFERALRQSSAWVIQIKRLPQSWTRPRVSPQADTTTVDPSPTVAVSPLPPLTTAQQQQIEAEVTQLQTTVQSVSDRLSALETQLGTNRAVEPLENRLAILTQQLATASGTAPPSPAPIPTATPAIAPVANAINSPVAYPADRLTVTLPTDLLFRAGQVGFSPETRNLLDSIVGDLRNYPGASVQVAAHTDDAGQPEAIPELAFQRAQMVQQYLASTLGNDYHWVVIGYGSAYPLAENNSAANRQRNRRIEIVIDPR